jgi:hypothetical protein
LCYQKRNNMLTLARVNKAIAAKWPGVILFKGEGNFFIYSDNKELDLKIGMLYQTSINVCAINHLSLEQWIESVDYVLQDKHELELSRNPVFPESEK